MAMRWLVIACVLAACRGGGDDHPTAVPRDGGARHAPAPRQPPTPAVELLHLAGAKVAVSSTVANAKLPPTALVDGDLKTAWNSRTGDLRGAWIAIRVHPVSRRTSRSYG